MTVRARATQFLPVHIISAVAGQTLEFCVLERRGQVAFLAGHDGMHANQRKARQVMVETDFITPASFAMTCSALLAFLSGMYIIGTMARMTFPDRLLLLQVTTMTCSTAHLTVLARQWKFGLLFMIEIRLVPSPGCVTGITFPAILPAVLVIAPVTGDTLRFQLFIQGALVAGIASHLAVFPG